MNSRPELPSPPPLPPTPAVRVRTPGIDFLRIVSSLAVVMAHSSSSFASYPEVFHWMRLRDFGVPVFCVLLAYLVTDVEVRDPGRPLGRVIQQRFLRLLVPWMFWTAAYFAIFDWLRPVLRGREVTWPTVLSVLDEGFLWFLPAAFVGSLGVLAALRGLPGWRREDRWAPWLWAISGAVFVEVTRQVVLAGGKVHVTSMAMPTFFCAGVVGRLVAEPARAFVDRAGGFLGLAALTVPLGAWHLHGGGRWVFVAYCLAVALWMWAPWTGRVARGFSAVAPLTYAVYLLHPLVIGSLQMVYSRSGWALPMFAVPLAGVTVFLLTLGLVRILRPIPGVRVVLPMN